MRNLGELGFKVGPSYFEKYPFSTLIRNNGIVSFTKPPSWIGVEKRHFYPKQEGPTLKPLPKI